MMLSTYRRSCPRRSASRPQRLGGRSPKAACGSRGTPSRSSTFQRQRSTGRSCSSASGSSSASGFSEMAVQSGLLRLETRGHGEIVDLTDGVKSVVRTAGIEQGLVTVFATGSTAAVTTMEYEPGGVSDLEALLERLIPSRGEYEHNRLNHDTNSHAHLRAALIGPSETIPLIEGHLALGTWQQVVLIDFDDRPRQRAVTVQVLA